MDLSSRLRGELAAIVESSDDAIIGKSLDGIVTSWNSGAQRIFGYTAGEMVGQPISRLIPEHLIAEEEAILARLKRGERIQHLETTRQHKNGGHIDISVTVSPIRDDAGHLIGASKVARDITERKRIERELRETSAQLVRSNHDLEQYAYVASHDLQEPLRAVIACVQLLRRQLEGQLDERADQLSVHAVQGAIRMQTLIADLLTYSRLGSEGHALQPVDCGSALDLALANLSVTIQETGAEVVRSTLPKVQAIPALLALLFQNLLANAVKFRRKDQAPRIEVGARLSDGEWRISVEDNGIGIDPQYHDRIFEIFQRLHTRDEYPGTGIGLALCRRIVQLHGGTITVESAVGRGARFTFTLLPVPAISTVRTARPARTLDH